MLCRGSENLKKYLFYAAAVLAFLAVGCSTSPDRHGRYLAPHNSAPDNFYTFFYYSSQAGSIDYLKKIIEKSAADYGVPGMLVRNTRQIRAVTAEDNLEYFILNGRYPDSFIKDRLRNNEEWEEDTYRGLSCFYNTEKGAIIIHVVNNCIIASFKEPGLAVSVLKNNAENIINQVYESSSIHNGILEETALLVNIRKIDDSFKFLIPEQYNRKNIIEIIFSLNRKIQPGNILELSGEITFSSDREASLFSTVFKIFFADWLRKEGIGSFAVLMKNNSITVENNKLFIRNIDVTDEKADSVFIQMMENTGVIK